ncbi:MAG: hypothetical protein IJD93_00670 [Ruminococcus sp.]|nr:hypothetical protein [Ruminococcus sp.]
MNRKQVDSIWMGVSVFFFLLLSVSFLLMPIGNETSAEGISIYSFIAGLVFWISLIMGIVTQCILAYRRKTWYVMNRARKVRSTQRIGLFSFFENTYAAVADVVAIISLIGLIIALFATQGIGYICYVLFSLFVFSFSMHCILNGKIYYHVVYQNKLLQTIEKERANSSKEERKERNG